MLKPSELTPLSTLRLAELALEVLPPRRVQRGTGDGNPVGAAIVTPSGRAHGVADRLGAHGQGDRRRGQRRSTRVHLELGGKAPVVVFDDADVEAVVGRARRRVLQRRPGLHRGHAHHRHPGVHDAVLEALVRRLEPAAGRAARRGRRVGPGDLRLPTRAVLGFVERAAADGARSPAGASAWGSRGFFVEPTVIVGPTQDSEIIQREVFGPVITVQRAADEAQALRGPTTPITALPPQCGPATSGLACGAARALNFGCVWINDHLPFLSEMPHGGFGQSGYGKDLSTYALEEYTRIKHVMASLA